MNLNTLSKSQSDYKSGSLPVALYPNKMRQNNDGKLSYYVRLISRGVCTNTDIVNDVMANGLNGDLSKEQLLRAAELFTNARLSRVSDGYIVDDGICRICAKITGTFESESDTFSTERHGVTLSAHATASAKEVLADLRPVIRQGNSAKPIITDVYDLESGSQDTLTRGGFLDIRGANICIGGDAENVGLHFEYIGDSKKNVRLTAKKLGTNTTTHIACVVPLNLAEGSYRLRIVTQFTNPKPLKKPLSFLYESLFTVA